IFSRDCSSDVCSSDLEALTGRLTREWFRQSPDRSQWRYFALLPLARRETIQDLQVGWTPLYLAGRLGEHLGFPNLYIKDDGRNQIGRASCRERRETPA